jgi:hypothetical protein
LIPKAEFIINGALNRLTLGRKELNVDRIEAETQALFQVKHNAKCLGYDDNSIKTSRGYFGKFSALIFGDGDLICILLGCPVPMVLRNASDDYELRGQIYVEGIMHREAMACLEAGECKLQDFELH